MTARTHVDILAYHADEYTLETHGQPGSVMGTVRIDDTTRIYGTRAGFLHLIAALSEVAAEIGRIETRNAEEAAQAVELERLRERLVLAEESDESTPMGVRLA